MRKRTAVKTPATVAPPSMPDATRNLLAAIEFTGALLDKSCIRFDGEGGGKVLIAFSNDSLAAVAALLPLTMVNLRVRVTVAA